MLIACGVMAHVWLVPRTDVAVRVPGAMNTPVTTTASTVGQPDRGPAITISSSVDAKPTPDSSSTPDTIYPAEPSPVGTTGRLRPARLVESDAGSAVPAGDREFPVSNEAPDDTADAVVDLPARNAGREKAVPIATVVELPPAFTPVAASRPIGEPDGATAPEEMPGSAMRAEEELVYLAVQEYRAAYERLDAAAAKTVWPSVDAGALRHAFNQLSGQRLNFESCGVTISGNSASARCRGQAEYLPKVGSRRAFVKAGEWVFDLARQDTAWQIVSAKIQ